MRKFLTLLIIALFAVSLLNKVHATTCAGAATIPATPTFPWVSSLTCGTTNDITAANATVCGSGSYLGGLEAVYAWTPASNYIDVSFAYSGVTWSGLFLYQGCPTSGGVCIGNFTGSGATKTLAYIGTNMTSGTKISVTSGVTYYLVIDTWPSPASPCPGTITINGTINAACSGTPAPGNTLASSNPACSGVSFVLSLQYSTPGTGVTYQWQYSLTGGVPWTTIGASTPTHTTSQLVTTWYRCNVTCSGFTGTSTPVQVTMNTPSNCYCVPTTTNGCSADYISNVTFNGINRSSTCDGSGINYYTTPNPSVTQGSGYTLSVTTGGDTEGVRAWADWNQDGTFDNTTELVLGPSYLGTNPATYSITVNVPAGATLGATRLRVRCSYAAAPLDACASQSYGEAEDYMITVVAPSSYTLSWYNLQWPVAPLPIQTTQNVTVYAQCWEAGVTPPAGPGTGITCWIGYNALNTNPNTWSNWVATSYNFGADPSNNDEYMANLGAAQSLAPGTYYFASRFQYNGGPMTYGGYNLGGGGAWDGMTNVSGTLIVLPPEITPTATCQTFVGNFPTTGLMIGVNLTTANVYNFSCCSLDATCAGAGAANDIDFTLYAPDGVTEIWYIDGTTGCSYDASTWGSAYENYLPPSDGKYWLKVDDYYSAVGGGFTLGYIAGAPAGIWSGATSTDWFTSTNWADGSVPLSTDNVTIPAGCPNYPIINTPASCNKLTINENGLFYIAPDSFFDVFLECVNAGGISVSGGTMNIAGNLYLPAPTATLNMTGGILNTAGIFETADYTWSDGTYTLSGGTINMSGTAFFYGGTGSTMSGNFVFNVGGTLQIPSTMWTLTGGTINLLGTETAINYFLPPTGTGTAVAYNLNVNAGTASYIFARDLSINGVSIGNDFNVQSGTVDLLNLTGNVGAFTVGGNLTISPSNNANLNIPAISAVTVNGSVNQSVIQGTGYGAIMGPATINGGYNFTTTIPGLSTGKWELISPPISNATANTFLCQYLMQHDPITNTWIDIINPGNLLDEGVDYALWVHPNVMTGNVPCAVIPPNTSFTWSGARNAWAPVVVPTLNGWNNVGNPYSATIDWTSAAWTKTNIVNTIYFENAGTWSGYVAGVPYNGGSQYIAPTQGFFVESTGAGSLGFATGTTTFTRTTFYKSDISNILRLVASGNGRTDETVIRILDVATAGFDSEYDAHKLFNNAVEYPEVPQFYSMDNGYMAVNAIDGGEMVALGFKAGLPGVYTISQTESTDFNTVILEDLVTGTFTDLLQSNYTFQYDPSGNEARFIVHFTPLAVGNNLAEAVNIYAYSNVAYVNVPENVKGDIKVYNMMGQEVATSPLNNVLNSITLPSGGSYIVKVTTNEKVFTQKINIQ